MKYPQFFNDVEKITLEDPLSSFLGTFEHGIIEFSYTDIVKSAGHSCPTVAGAYLMTLKALKVLYKNKLPVRGEIKVEFKENQEEGVAGVVAAVVSNITGATETTGFKGLGGRFDRRGLLSFGSNIASAGRFARIDTEESVDVFYNPNVVNPEPETAKLMEKFLKKEANPGEIRLFGRLWQNRIQKILIDNFNNDEMIKVIDVRKKRTESFRSH